MKFLVILAILIGTSLAEKLVIGSKNPKKTREWLNSLASMKDFSGVFNLFVNLLILC